MDNSGFHNYLNNEINNRNNTSLEISIQPILWQQTWDCVLEQQDRLKEFLGRVYALKDLNIILTGAGTSAFIGDALQGFFQKYTGILTRSISSTNLVTHPELFLLKDKPTLLISFARSGDSPESVAVVNLINKICKTTYHLIITCNPSGKLASENNRPDRLVFLLPEKTNDKGLAMTASFTSMLLCGVLIARIHELDKLNKQKDQLIAYGNNILANYVEKLHQVANMDFKRAVFLGSGPLLGTARESHLKLQELTNGKIICKNDSFLGFRHGPKAVIDENTLVVYLFSSNNYVEKYEDDLVLEICKQKLGMYSIGVLERSKEKYCLDLTIQMGDGERLLDDEFQIICYVLPAQILGYYKSLAFGLNPDNPSESGVISRVVQGVIIYSYE